ncbi:MAG: BrnT family toxin [Parvibaculum sp.]
MTTDTSPFDAFFAAFEHFEWDKTKRATNIEKHGIDFIDILSAFDRPMLRKRSDRNDGMRYLIIGDAHGHEIAVAYKEIGTSCRIISARRASKAERATYHAHFAQSDE